MRISRVAEVQRISIENSWIHALTEADWVSSDDATMLASTVRLVDRPQPRGRRLPQCGPIVPPTVGLQEDHGRIAA